MKKCGFSILEVMIAIAVISSLGLGIYRLQLSQLSATQQALARQLAMQSASNLANQMYAHLNYSPNSISRTNVNAYMDSSSSVNITLPNGSNNCNTNNCNDSTYVAWVLANWRLNLKNSMNLPSGNVCAQVCTDSTVPTITNGSCSMGCSGNSNRTYIKIVWQSHLESAEVTSLGLNNYIVLPVSQR